MFSFSPTFFFFSKILYSEEFLYIMRYIRNIIFFIPLTETCSINSKRNNLMFLQNMISMLKTRLLLWISNSLNLAITNWRFRRCQPHFTSNKLGRVNAKSWKRLSPPIHSNLLYIPQTNLNPKLKNFSSIILSWQTLFRIIMGFTVAKISGNQNFWFGALKLNHMTSSSTHI